MKHLYLSAAAAALLIAGGAAFAQQPVGLSPTALEWNYIGQSAPAAAPAVPVAAPGCGPATQKVCVIEPDKKTKVEYCSKCEEFCIKKCPSLFGFLHGLSGCDCNCCEMRTRKVLIKKVVPDCDGTKCVVKEVPVGCAAPGPPAVAPVPAPTRSAVVPPGTGYYSATYDPIVISGAQLMPKR
jgi:hypothetical protein